MLHNSQFSDACSPIPLCGKCRDGYIDYEPEEVGWKRLTQYDTKNDIAYRTTGGAIFKQPRFGTEKLVVSSLCNCMRKAMNFPLDKHQHDE